MQGAGLADMLQLLADDVDALAEQPPVGLDLRLAGTAEKAEAAALPLEVGPGADQPALLIDEMGELDLQAPFPRPRALAEDFEDQPGAVEHLDVPRRLEIALLHRRQRMIDDHQAGILGAYQPRQLLDLAGAEQGRRPRVRHRHHPARLDVEIDGGGEADRFIEACLRRSLDGIAGLGDGSALPACFAEHRRQHHRLDATVAVHGLLPAPRPFLALQLFRVGRTQLLSGTFRVGDV